MRLSNHRPILLFVILISILAAAVFSLTRDESGSSGADIAAQKPPMIQLSLEDVLNETGFYLGKDTTVIVPAPPQRESTGATATSETTTVPVSFIVVVDPGHQAKADTRTEPIAPWSSEQKMRVTAGATGKNTGVAESELMLEIAFDLEKELEAKGINVFLTRTRNDVNVSNRQRAEVANSLGADLFIRLHANSSTDETQQGALAICQPEVPQLDGVYQESRKAADIILNTYCEQTGIKNLGVVTRDDITGLNWSRSPAVLIELGFLSNASDEAFLVSSRGRQLVVKALASGIETYLRRKNK